MTCQVDLVPVGGGPGGRGQPVTSSRFRGRGGDEVGRGHGFGLEQGVCGGVYGCGGAVELEYFAELGGVVGAPLGEAAVVGGHVDGDAVASECFGDEGGGAGAAEGVEDDCGGGVGGGVGAGADV